MLSWFQNFAMFWMSYAFLNSKFCHVRNVVCFLEFKILPCSECHMLSWIQNFAMFWMSYAFLNSKFCHVLNVVCFLDFKILPCSECRMLSSGCFTGVCSLNANVSQHFVCGTLLWRWNRQCVMKCWHLTLSLLMSYIYGTPSKARNLTSYMDKIFYWGFCFLNRVFR
jgi:hypothetical protein